MVSNIYMFLFIYICNTWFAPFSIYGNCAHLIFFMVINKLDLKEMEEKTERKR